MNLSDKAYRCLHSLYDFCLEYWKLDLVPQPHKAMCHVFQETEDDNEEKPYGMLVVPRGTYKTSIGRAAVVWKQLRQIHLFDNVYHRIVICSDVLAHGETSLRLIEGQLRNNKPLNEDYGPLWINDRKNNQSSRHPEGINLAPRVLRGEVAAIAEPSLWVGSTRRVSTGFHADGALVDDLNNQDNVSTDDRREKQNDYWRLLFPILGAKDRAGRRSTIMLNGTPWHDADVRGTILRQERERLAADPDYKSKWTILHAPAIDENENLFFPSVLTREFLESQREDMSANKFAANYLCDPIGDKGFVSEEEIQWKSRELFPELKYLRATVDPSQHTKAKALGCYTAIMVSGYDRFANLYFRDARGSREWDTAEFIAALFALNDDYPDIPILIENKHMAHFDHAIRLEEARRTAESKDNKPCHLRIQYVIAEGETKYQKWEKLQPRFRNRRVFLAEEIQPKLKAEIREELVRGTAARFKDFLDAMAMAELGIRPKVARDGEALVAAPSLLKPGQVTFGQALGPELERLLAR